MFDRGSICTLTVMSHSELGFQRGHMSCPPWGNFNVTVYKDIYTFNKVTVDTFLVLGALVYQQS